MQEKIQFYIDAFDRAVGGSDIEEKRTIINHFPINLELNPGTTFTERATYTGIYNISGLGFDMSFRVQCSENYYGQNCNFFCKPVPVDGVYYNCSSEEKVDCLHILKFDELSPDTSICIACYLSDFNTSVESDDNINCGDCLLPGYDVSSDCTTCLPDRALSTKCTECIQPGLNPSTNCTECLPGYDESTDCESCLPGFDLESECTKCLPGYNISTNCTRCSMGRDFSTNCTQCLAGYNISTGCTTCLSGRDITYSCSECIDKLDIATNCSECLLSDRDPSTNCTTCLWIGHDPATNCTGCLPNYDPTTNCSSCKLGWDLSTGCTECLQYRNKSTGCHDCDSRSVLIGSTCISGKFEFSLSCWSLSLEFPS